MLTDGVTGSSKDYNTLLPILLPPPSQLRAQRLMVAQSQKGAVLSSEKACPAANSTGPRHHNKKTQGGDQ